MVHSTPYCVRKHYLWIIIQYNKRVLAFTQAAHLLMTSYLFLFSLLISECGPLSLTLLLSVYNKASRCKLKKLRYVLTAPCCLPSCLCSLLPQIPVHHMLPWVLICLCSSSSHSGGLNQHIRSRCNANFKHQLAHKR